MIAKITDFYVSHILVENGSNRVTYYRFVYSVMTIGMFSV